MTYTLVFDTETTGLPNKKSKSLEEQPYVIQLAGILFRDEDQHPVAHFSSYVEPLMPDGSWAPIPNERFWIENLLDKESILPLAINPATACKVFDLLARRADRFVAHNAAFDRRLLNITYCRYINAEKGDFWRNRPIYCTMESTTDIMKLPGKYRGSYKWPRLDEAYKEFVDPEGFADAHDAMADVNACAKLLWAIEARGIQLFQL